MILKGHFSAQLNNNERTFNNLAPARLLNVRSLLLTTKPMLGRFLFLLQNRFLALELPNLNRSG